MSAADTPDPESGPQPTAHNSDGMTRRELVRRGGTIGAGAIGTIAVGDRVVPRFSPIGRAQAIALTTTATLVAGAAIAGVVVGAIATGGESSSDGDAILEQRAKELHDRVWLDATEMQMVQAPMMESLQGDVQMLRQLARSDAAFAIMQAASDEVGETQAQSDAKAAVRDAFANVEANFYDTFSGQMTKVHNRADLVQNDSELTASDVYRWIGTANQGMDLIGLSPENSGSSAHEATAELVNGSTHSVTVTVNNDGSGSVNTILVPWAENQNATLETASDDTTWKNPIADFDSDGNYTGSFDYVEWGVKALDRESGDTTPMLDCFEWWQIHDNLLTMLNEELTHVETMVSNLYQPAVDGEIDIHSISSGSAILEEARDGSIDTWKQAAGIYRSMWLPESTDPAVVELENGVKLEGQMFWSDPADEGLEVGTSINPENTIGRIYMAAEIRHVPETPEEDMASVTVSVVDGSGNAVTDALVDVKGSDTTHSADSNGEVTIDVSPGHTTFYVTDEDSTTSETAVSMDVADGDSVQITHDGTDNSSYQADPFDDETLVPEDEGTVVVPHFTDKFTVLGVHEKPDAAYLEFEKPYRVQPDDDYQTYEERAKDAADREQETREETEKVIIEETSGDDADLGLPTFFDGDGGGLLGLGIIGVVVLSIVGVVTDLLPGMEN